MDIGRADLANICLY